MAEITLEDLTTPSTLTLDSTPYIASQTAPLPSSSSSHSKTRSSARTQSTVEIRTFEQETGKEAGAPLLSIPKRDPYAKGKEIFTERNGCSTGFNEFWPFRDQKDYILARWLYRAKTSLTAINEYCQDVMEDDRKHIYSFTTGEQWRQRMHDIPWGIPNDTFYKANIEIATKSGTDQSSQRRIIYHRDVIDVVRFLLGHGPFENNLKYAPERHYTAKLDEDESASRVYNEMHTGDWWWRTQKDIPDGGTIIPILISSDKTVLSQHHGDMAMWPVYISIGNLDSKCRRSQIRPSFVLVGEIPIVKYGKEHSKEMKSHTYHTAMREIFRRKFKL